MIFSYRLHPVLDARKFLNSRFNILVAYAEASCGGCGKADILPVVSALEPFIFGGCGNDFFVSPASVFTNPYNRNGRFCEIIIFIKILHGVADEIIATRLIADDIQLCGNIALKAVIMVKMLGINICHNGNMGRSGCEFKLV